MFDELRHRASGLIIALNGKRNVVRLLDSIVELGGDEEHRHQVAQISKTSLFKSPIPEFLDEPEDATSESDDLANIIKQVEAREESAVTLCNVGQKLARVYETMRSLAVGFGDSECRSTSAQAKAEILELRRSITWVVNQLDELNRELAKRCGLDPSTGRMEAFDLTDVGSELERIVENRERLIDGLLEEGTTKKARPAGQTLTPEAKVAAAMKILGDPGWYSLSQIVQARGLKDVDSMRRKLKNSGISPDATLPDVDPVTYVGPLCEKIGQPPAKYKCPETLEVYCGVRELYESEIRAVSEKLSGKRALKTEYDSP